MDNYSNILFVGNVTVRQKYCYVSHVNVYCLGFVPNYAYSVRNYEYQISGAITLLSNREKCQTKLCHFCRHSNLGPHIFMSVCVKCVRLCQMPHTKLFVVSFFNARASHSDKVLFLCFIFSCDIRRIMDEIWRAVLSKRGQKNAGSVK